MTASNPLPEDVRDLILKRIDSVGHLEALLLLWGDSSAGKDIATVAKQLYISELETTSILDQLCKHGFTVRTGNTFQYHCVSSELADLVNRLGQLYRTHLIPVTNLIHGKSATRIREFADAFKLRKDR